MANEIISLVISKELAREILKQLEHGNDPEHNQIWIKLEQIIEAGELRHALEQALGFRQPRDS